MPLLYVNFLKVPKNIRERFFIAISRLETNPLVGIPLKGEFEGSRKVRLGDWRIESRQGVYK